MLNPIVLTPRSQSNDVPDMRASNLSESIVNQSNQSQKVWVPTSQLVPSWGLAYEEYKSFLFGLLGGTLSCLSGWLIARSLRRSVTTKQYKWCIIEIIIRYLFSVSLMLIYCNQYYVEMIEFESKNWFFGYGLLYLLDLYCLQCLISSSFI